MHGGIIIEPIYFTHEVSRIWVLRQTVGTVKFAVWKFFFTETVHMCLFYFVLCCIVLWCVFYVSYVCILSLPSGVIK